LNQAHIMHSSAFFTPGKLGPLVLRNRSIRAAAFEGMSRHNGVTSELIDYHRAVAAGEVGMTTVAYASVNKSGLSFPHQMWLRPEIIPDLKRLTEAIKKEGAAASIQIGHCGNMASQKLTGLKPLAPSGGINWYGPTFPRTMKKVDIRQTVDDFRTAAGICAEAGFDAVEVHAGHGYLISQFLSPYTNRRKDEYGGSFENRSRFLREVLTAVKETLPAHMALIVKMNCWDGFKEGITREEGLKTAEIIEACGAHAIVVSGGFVSRSPMFVLRGSMPIKTMAHFIKDPFKKFFVSLFGHKLIKTVPFKEGYFMEESSAIKSRVKIPIILVGGMNSMKTIDSAMEKGFEFIGIARALIQNTNYVKELKSGKIDRTACTVCNYCVAKMYTDTMECFMNQQDVPRKLVKEIQPEKS
jgi:2,4-dienoyl-CoA reductase-like NADH-dependent reductase (Old Yellow Enzyme family)